MRIVIALFCLSLLHACTFDNEPAYVPVTQSILLLTIDSQQVSNLSIITDQVLEHEVEGQIGLAPSSVSDLDSDQDQGVWLSTPSQRQVHYLASFDALLETYSLGDFKPYFISVGQTYALLSDTTIPAIGFFHLSNHTLLVDTLAVNPGKALYRSRYFFLPLDDTLAIYQEDALAARRRLGCEAPIVWLANMVRIANSVEVICRDSSDTYLSYTVDYNRLQWVDATPESVSYRKVWYTPYHKTYFASQRFTSAEVPISGRNQDLFIDFLMGERYLVRQGELVRDPGRTGAQDTLGILSGDIRSMYFQVKVSDL